MQDLSTNFYSKCLDAVKVAAREKAAELAHGGADSFSDYKMECGIIRGLDLATYIMEQVLTDMAKEDKE